jgi:monoamine oxidase
MKKSIDVVIVGGGIAGLYAAQQCIDRGLHVVLLEKENRLGGRIQTVYSKTYQYETGAGRFAANHNVLRGLLSRYGMTESPIPTTITYEGKRSPVPALLKRLMSGVRRYDYITLTQRSFRQVCNEVLGVNDTNTLINAFGYNAEFDKANAYTAIEMFKRDYMKYEYYACREGFSELVHRMANYIRQYARIYMSTHVTRIKEHTDGCVVYATDVRGNPRTYVCKAVVCAMPRKELEAMCHFTHGQKRLLKTVVPISLNRIYGKFPALPQPWFQDTPRTTTSNPIRQFIPINRQAGVAMVSYSDTKYADYWDRIARQPDDTLKKTILANLHAVFPTVPTIPEPEWIRSYYWSEGVHFWKPGTDVEDIRPRIQQIMPRTFIVGEAYSKVQGWIEGALISVDDVMNDVVTRVKYLLTTDR